MPLEHPVEIKITVGDDAADSLPGAVENAIKALNLPPGRTRRIWFLEDLTAGLPQRLPMLGQARSFGCGLMRKRTVAGKPIPR
jgi:hypothetical protein